MNPQRTNEQDINIHVYSCFKSLKTLLTRDEEVKSGYPLASGSGAGIPPSSSSPVSPRFHRATDACYREKSGIKSPYHLPIWLA